MIGELTNPLPIRPGGLMRCCTGTYAEIAPPARMTSEGDMLACSYCAHSMIVKDGAWEWNDPHKGLGEPT